MTNPPSPSEGRLKLPGFEFDLDANELRTDAGEHVSLRPQCLDVLRCLAQKPGHVVGKDSLMRAVWADLVVTDDSLVQCIRSLRQAIGDHAHRVVQTEPKRGYRLVATRIPAAVHAPNPLEADVRQDVRFATTEDGIRIAYASVGHGDPVVRAGRFASHLDYDWTCLTESPLLHHLAKRYRLVRYDRRGQGLSDRESSTGSIDDQVRDLKAVVDAVGLPRFVLLGNGSGAAYAIRFAATYPARVSRLILLGGYARGVARRGKASQPEASRNAYGPLFAHHWDEDNPLARQMVTSRHYPGATREQAASHNELLRHACTSSRIVEVIWSDGSLDVSADLRRINCPTLVAHSPHDAVVPFAEGRLLAASIPGARLRVFDSVNRVPMPEEPAFADLTRTIDEFIGESDFVRTPPATPAADPKTSRAALRVATDAGAPPPRTKRQA